MPVLHRPIQKKDWVREMGERNGFPALPEDLAPKPVRSAGLWEPAVQKIVEFQHLGDDWDGPGTKAPSRELLESAIGLAYVFYQNGVPPPQRVAPGVDGSVLFEWQDPDGTYTEVETVRPF